MSQEYNTSSANTVAGRSTVLIEPVEVEGQKIFGNELLDPHHKRLKVAHDYTGNGTFDQIHPKGDFQTYLENVTVMQVPREKRDVITVSSKDSIRKIFRTLVRNKILSAPVYDPDLDNYIGFADMLDIVTSVVKIRTEEDYKQDDKMTLLEQEVLFSSQKVDDIVDISKRSPLIPVGRSASVFDAMKLIALKDIYL